MKQVVVYTMSWCPYCIMAKRLLDHRRVAYQETMVAEDDDAKWAELEKRSGMKTMPQIYVRQADGSETLVGGYRELAALDARDQLASLK